MTRLRLIRPHFIAPFPARDSLARVSTEIFTVYVARCLVFGTGANTGIGYELVSLLAQQGHKVYLGARNPAAGREAA